MSSIPKNQSPENPVWSEALERYRQVPLGLQLCSFLFSTEPNPRLPIPDKPWVALACDPGDERFYRMEFCGDEPVAKDFEHLLLRLFESTRARPEFIEVVDTDIAMDIASFCRALDIRIELRESLAMAENRISLIRNAIVADVARRDDEGDGASDGE